MRSLLSVIIQFCIVFNFVVIQQIVMQAEVAPSRHAAPGKPTLPLTRDIVVRFWRESITSRGSDKAGEFQTISRF